MSISILIAEDDPLLRNLLGQIVADQPELRVVGQAVDGAQALEMAGRLQPDVLLLDLGLPTLTGLEVLERLGQLPDPPQVLVLSGDERHESQLAAVRQGASGFVCKSRAFPALPEAIRAVAGGRVWLAEEVIGQVIREYSVLVRQAKTEPSAKGLLTERETEVLVRIGKGLTNQQIAAELYMSLSTVKTHLQRIFRKLDLPNRTEAAVFAVREGLLDDTPPAP